MTNYHFIEDTRILFYASLSLRMVQVINRLLEGGELCLLYTSQVR